MNECKTGLQLLQKYIYSFESTSWTTLYDFFYQAQVSRCNFLSHIKAFCASSVLRCLFWRQDPPPPFLPYLSTNKPCPHPSRIPLSCDPSLLSLRWLKVPATVSRFNPLLPTPCVPRSWVYDLAFIPNSLESVTKAW